MARAAGSVSGTAELDLADVASRLSTLPTLGSYRLRLDGQGALSALALTTLDGALRLDAQRRMGRLPACASAAKPAPPPAPKRRLSNLLNIIGRRQGERSLIAIG